MKAASRPRAARPSLGQLAVVVVALFGVGLLVAACGGPRSAGVARLGPTTTTAHAPTFQASGGGNNPVNPNAKYRAAFAYVGCMRSHGVANFPDPTFSGREVHDSGVGSNSSQLQSAMGACKTPSVGGLGG